MSFKDFRILESLGKGSFASVHKVIRKSDNKIYAMKRVKINKMSKKEIGDALNEIRFLASIRQKNIVGFLEAFLESGETELCIIMEYCGCGDLAQKVERYKRRRQYIDEDVIWRYLVQSLKALQCLHDSGICHRDLKVANTFIGEDGSIKIGDMNVSKRLKNGQLQTQIGTPYYMSPEIWNNRPYDASSDMWSLGCMFYELCALKPPFVADSFPALKRVVTAGKYTPISRKYTEALHRTIGLLLRVNPRERPSAEALLRSGDLASKLQLDELAVAFAQQRSRDSDHTKLMETIKVPQQLAKLGAGLPKPCYPDVRPNSPTSWTMAEQMQQHQQQHPHPPLRPPVPPTIGDLDKYHVLGDPENPTSGRAKVGGGGGGGKEGGGRGRPSVAPLGPVDHNVVKSHQQPGPPPSARQPPPPPTAMPPPISKVAGGGGRPQRW